MRAVLVGIAALLSVSVARGDNLGDFVEALEEGTWGEYSSSNYGRQITEGANGRNSIFEYAVRMHWDPVLRRLWFYGAAHVDKGQSVDSKLVYFDARSDRWSQGDDPTGIAGCCHAYDTQALDVSERKLYKNRYSSKEVATLDLDTGRWDSSNFTLEMPGRPSAMEVFPGFMGTNSLIYVGSDEGLWARNLANSEAVRLYTTGSIGKGELTAGLGHMVMEYEPVNQLMIFGGGNDKTDLGKDGRALYRLDRHGAVEALDRIPTDFSDGGKRYIGASPKQGILCAGGNGKLYGLRTKDSGSSILYELDPAASSGSQWRKLATPPVDTSNTSENLVLCSYVSSEKAIVYTTESKNPKMFVYKPGPCQGDCPETDTISPRAPTALTVELIEEYL